jgi:hypothetical protein
MSIAFNSKIKYFLQLREIDVVNAIFSIQRCNFIADTISISFSAEIKNTEDFVGLETY